MRDVRSALVALFVCAGFAAAPAARAMDEVRPGEVPRLEADEGFLVVAVDVNMDVDWVKLQRTGTLFGAETVRSLKEGRNFRLYVAKAGSYAWSKIRPGSYLTLKVDDKDKFAFNVLPGKLTYPGDFLFRARSVHDSWIHVANRGLGAMDWLRDTHPAIHARYEFAYSGDYPDPFPAFYREVAGEAVGEGPDTKLLSPPQPGPLPVPVKDLWKRGRVLQARMNPAGDMVAVEIHPQDGRWGIELIDLVAGTVTEIASSNVEFDWVHWSSDRTLLMPSIDDHHLNIIRIGASGSGKTTFEALTLPRRGMVVDALPDDPDHILYASSDSQGMLMVHRVDISSQAAIDAFQFRFRDRLNKYVSNDRTWFTDGRGRLRLGIVERTMPGPDGEDEERRVLLHGLDGRFRDVMLLEREEPFRPVGVSADGARIYGIAEKDRDQRELVELDPATGRIVRTLFSRTGIDVSDAIFDWRHEVAGVRYYQGGRLVSEYFDAATNAQAELLRNTFGGQNVIVGGRSRDGGNLLLWVESGRQPAQLYHLDVAGRRASLLDETRPWLDVAKLAPTHRLEVKAGDGMRIEAFLTLPDVPGDRPLVLLPHGGPIGVADRLHFDPQVQFLASLGYAVLRVNFRGSAGYGRAFREAGRGQYGKGIEDDIDLALEHALANHPLDASRMCAVGSSYGGYSSLMAAVRWPKRFRCVVSISGVSDRILFFTASDSARNESVRRLMVEAMGDPHKDLEEMTQVSPLFQYASLGAPVMIVHGRDDLRVDYEHARRLARMLSLGGKPPVGLVFDKEGHGFSDMDNIQAMWEGVAGFLRQHLGGGGATSAAAAP